MSLFADLYEMGAGASATARTTTSVAVTPAQARRAVTEADKIAVKLHRDIERNAREGFRLYWHKFYNQWISYRTLHAEREIGIDPARVANEEILRFTRRLAEWRAALDRETGTGAAVGQGAGQGGQDKPFPWRPVLVIGGVAVGTVLARMWWEDRQERKRVEEERKSQETRAAQFSQPATLPWQLPWAPAPQPIVVQVPSPAPVMP